MEILNSPLGKLVISLVLLVAIAPVVVRFFRSTWVELEAEAAATRLSRSKAAPVDGRVPLTFALGALSLLLINYYGSHDFYSGSVEPLLQNYSNSHPGHLDM